MSGTPAKAHVRHPNAADGCLEASNPEPQSESSLDPRHSGQVVFRAAGYQPNLSSRFTYRSVHIYACIQQTQKTGMYGSICEDACVYICSYTLNTYVCLCAYIYVCVSNYLCIHKHTYNSIYIHPHGCAHSNPSRPVPTGPPDVVEDEPWTHCELRFPLLLLNRAYKTHRYINVQKSRSMGIFKYEQLHEYISRAKRTSINR